MADKTLHKVRKRDTVSGLNHLYGLVLAQMALPISNYPIIMIKQLDICRLPNPLSYSLCGRAQTHCGLVLGRQDLLFRV